MTVSERREREREERRGAILEAAQDVFYAKGLEQATMDDVASAAQLGKGTLYLYFKSKEEMLLALAVRHQRSMITVFEAAEARASTGRQALEGMLQAYASRISSPMEHFRVVVTRWVSATPFDCQGNTGEAMCDNVKRVFGLMCGAVVRGQADGSIRAELEPAKTALQLWSSVNGALLLRLQLQCLPTGADAARAAGTLNEHIALVVAALCPCEPTNPSHAACQGAD